MYENVAVLALLAFLYSVVAGRMERTPINGALVFMGFGLALGPVGLGVLNVSIDQVELRVLADLTLALMLFIDAANADLPALRRASHIPTRMLLLGLPMVIGAGMLAGGWLFDDVGLYELAILATMLAATDAALGKPVVSNKAVPVRVREGLNAESGLNDGLCVPILFTFIALASGSQAEGGSTALALSLVAREIGIGLVVGLGLTALGIRLLEASFARGWVSEVWLQVTAVALAIGCFTLAQSLHGSGYIAAFVGGVLFGAVAKGDTHKLVLAGEGVAEAMSLATWVVFGAVVVGAFYTQFTWNVLLYSFLSLTVIRMLPMSLALSGTGEPLAARLFLGWFGPRGLASIVFLIIVLDEDLPGSGTLAATVVCTVSLSVLLHGVTAIPLSSWFGAHEARRPRSDSS
jgi:NhaP-type Na+/H+ or K+/H+ antiporter